MNEVFIAAQEVEAFCRKRGLSHCIIGGVALHRWGEPRTTRNVDLTVLAGWGEEEPVIDLFLEQFRPRMADAREFAVANRVLLVQAGNGVGIDIALGTLPFERDSLRRASLFPMPEGVALTTCSAEDPVVHKAFANRGRDWVDVESILIRSGSRLNATQILKDLAPLVRLKEQPEIVDRLKALATECGLSW